MENTNEVLLSPSASVAFPSSEDGQPYKTYVKKDGTTNQGIKYERLNISSIILKLTTEKELSDQVQDYQISSSDKIFGIFDDIVCEIEKVSSTEKYALQIKYVHDNDKHLTPKDLQCDKKFSLWKYFQDFLEHRDVYDGFSLILFTNKKFDNTNNKICIGDKKNRVQIFIEKCEPNSLINTSTDENCCYKFRIHADEESLLELEDDLKEKYSTFFSNLYLYTNQMNVEELQADISFRLSKFYNEETSNKTDLNENSINRLLKFIKIWYDREDEKIKLQKSMMKTVLALSLLHPDIKNLSFKDRPLCRKKELLKEAMSNFDLTIFDDRKTDKILDLWYQAKAKLEEEIRTVRVQEIVKNFYHVISNRISCANILDDEECVTKLLWIINECPLVVQDTFTSRNVIKLLCSSKKIVLLGKTPAETFENFKVFNKLYNLLGYESLYDEILKSFDCSIQNKYKISLEDLVSRCGVLKEKITTNELLDMADGSLVISDTKEKVCQFYIPRQLSKIIIDSSFLEKFEENTCILISCWRKIDTYKNIIWEDIEDQISGIPPRKRTRTFKRAICKSGKQCSQEEFEELCDNHYTTCHHLRMTKDGKLEWLTSKGNITHLRKFQTTTDTIEEFDLIEYEQTNPINILCGNTGIGKTHFMRNLKNSYHSSNCWTIMVTVRNHYKHLDKNRNGDVKVFKDYMFENIINKDNEFFSSFISLLKEFKFLKIRYLWDGLDGISSQHLETVMTIIKDLVNEESQYCWINACNNFKEVLEDRFQVLARPLKPFDDKQQEDYINRRLQTSCASDVIGTFRSYVKEGMLEIPFLLSILVKYWPNSKTFSISELYKIIIDKKFLFHYRRKLRFNEDNAYQVEDIKNKIATQVMDYERAATKCHFGDIFNINCDNFLENIKRDGDIIEIIIAVDDRNMPVFCHNSFSEYFTASFLTKNDKNKTISLEKEQFRNIRMFRDAILNERI